MAQLGFPVIDLLRDALLFDFDGTLVDIAPLPDAVHVPAALRAALGQLSRASGGAVALISGRPIASLDRHLAPLHLAASGGHGAELRSQAGHGGPDWRAPLLPQEARASLAEIGQQIPGVLIEDKGTSLALHYRAIPEMEDAVIAAVRERMPALPEGYEMLRGKAIVEVKPKHINKGTAVRRLMAHEPFAGRRPVFLGDDITDEDCIAALPEFGGIGIAVGRDIAGAQYRVDGPQAVRDWVEDLAGRC